MCNYITRVHLPVVWHFLLFNKVFADVRPFSVRPMEQDII